MTHLPTVRASGELLVADLERRFYAFVVDQLVFWTLVALACSAAYELFWAGGRLWSGLALVAVATVLGWLALSALLALGGTSPGKAVAGLRVVCASTGGPIGAGRALLRGLVLVLVTPATIGIGPAMLAWTAVADPGRRRRGWHDRMAGSLVVDARPRPVSVAEDEASRHLVNLTAMRLGAAAPTPDVGATAPTQAAGPAPVPVAGTVAVAPRGWVLAFDTGERVRVDGRGPVLVGRRPVGADGEHVGGLVALSSTDMSLSKTHAQVALAADGALVVTDRGSTNGSVLTRQGVQRPLSRGWSATLLEGDVVRFGDRTMQVGREG